MLSDNDLTRVLGSTVYTGDGEKIGKVGQVFEDSATGRPEWATVHTGFFGTNESFVPLEAASFEGGELRVPYSKQRVKDAPNVDADAGQLDQSGERALFEYYGLPYDSAQDDQAEANPVEGSGAYGRTDAERPETDPVEGTGAYGRTETDTLGGTATVGADDRDVSGGLSPDLDTVDSQDQVTDPDDPGRGAVGAVPGVDPARARDPLTGTTTDPATAVAAQLRLRRYVAQIR